MRAATLLILSLIAASAGAKDEEFAQCILCHGTNANGNIGVKAPKLAGLDRDYLLRQLLAFRSGLRGTHKDDVSGSEMRIIALSFTEAQLKRAVEYIATLKPKSPVPTVQGDVKRGETLFNTCAACHGDKGQGNPALNAPALAGMSDWYLVIQLNNYRNGLRGTDPADAQGVIMKNAALALPDAQAVADVIGYITSAH